MAGLGHEERFPPPRSSARCRLGKATFGGTHDNEKDTPLPVIPPWRSLNPVVMYHCALYLVWDSLALILCRQLFGLVPLKGVLGAQLLRNEHKGVGADRHQSRRGSERNGELARHR
jgi:hypothetical protein